MTWRPPIYTFAIGKGEATDRSYRNLTRPDGAPHRILMKRTRSGFGCLKIGGRSVVLNPGDVFVISKQAVDVVYCYEGDGTPWVFDWVTVGHPAQGNPLPPEIVRDPVIHLDGGDELWRLFDRLQENQFDFKNPRSSTVGFDVLAYSLLLGLIERKLSPEAVTRPSAVERYKRMLDEYFDRGVSLKDLAEEIGYRQETLTRTFHAYHGVSPQRYVQALRIRKACQLIEEGALSLKQVAASCGFTTHNYFGRAFRRSMGMTPGHYGSSKIPVSLNLLLNGKYRET